MAPLPLPPDPDPSAATRLGARLHALIDRYRASRDAAIEAEAALLAARAVVISADQRVAELEAQMAAAAYGEASMRAQAADRAAKSAAVALADVLLRAQENAPLEFPGGPNVLDDGGAP